MVAFRCIAEVQTCIMLLNVSIALRRQITGLSSKKIVGLNQSHKEISDLLLKLTSQGRDIFASTRLLQGIE